MNKPGSKWMLLGASGAARYPTDGAGGDTGTFGSSMVAGASSSQPVYLEAVEVQACSTASTVAISTGGAADATSPVTTINVPVHTTSTQIFRLGGENGIRLDDGFSVNIGSNMTAVKVYFRYPG